MGRTEQEQPGATLWITNSSQGAVVSGELRRIAVVAPASRLSSEAPGRVLALAAALYPDQTPEIIFHPQCLAQSGHFAGDDAARAEAFVEVANDERCDAVWFARGGYGSGRLAEMVLPRLSDVALRKVYLGYSDGGALLAALYGAGFCGVAHGPMPQDVLRNGGEAAIARALAWLVDRDPGALEPSLDGSHKAAAFNIAILSSIVGTPLQPELSGHVLMLEEVSEPMYRIDRDLFHITANPEIRRVAGLRLGRCSAIPHNDPDFGMTEDEVARYWCGRSGIAWLGRADIGHDVDNKVVPYGDWR
jgi:muramoyltetrapeptide carboxypeptidase